MDANRVKEDAFWNDLRLKDIYLPRGLADGWFFKHFGNLVAELELPLIKQLPVMVLIKRVP